MSDTIINPMDRPCCANCSNAVVFNNLVSKEQLRFVVGYDCPYRDETPFRNYYNKDDSIIEISMLFDFVCNSWKSRGKPLNLDEPHIEQD